ncbi:MAG TPA: Holliday junction branch migration protein RuvA, partial [Cycloclasticus sp.]|nr:Holliday junction branch migration protein RuvA [Cycloclasticus sp.]
IDMRDRLPEQTGSSSRVAAGLTAPQTSPMEEAISALIALGYKPQDAEKRVRAVGHDDANSEQIIRSALQSAVKK